jgi:hypothetical protein
MITIQTRLLIAFGATLIASGVGLIAHQLGASLAPAIIVGAVAGGVVSALFRLVVLRRMVIR